uniref:hypothetical protein n=1 Tax=uncultured Flavonifractor sp. TaxID=1193534 RepID=UPI002638E8CB|nr:hypothetical protein [uncultured Flavonifractor sp.]
MDFAACLCPQARFGAQLPQRPTASAVGRCTVLLGSLRDFSKVFVVSAGRFVYNGQQQYFYCGSRFQM